MRAEGLVVGEGTVGPEQIDYNGHMNVVHYRAAFDLSTDGCSPTSAGPTCTTSAPGDLMVVE